MTLNDRKREYEIRRAEVQGWYARATEAATHASAQLLEIDAKLELLTELIADEPQGPTNG